MDILKEPCKLSAIDKLALIPWVHWDLIPIIANNDGDGVASTIFLLNHEKTKDKAVMKGLYTLDKLYLSDRQDRKNVKNMVGIDLEMQIKGMHCLGHHMNITCNPQSVNANDLFRVSENLLENFHSKCPLNTLMLLYWLLDEKPKNDKEIAFLVYWDSVIYNYNMYRPNVTQWLKRLGMEEILDALENRQEAIRNIINKDILPMTKAFKTGYEKSKLPQCDLVPFYDRDKKQFYFPQNKTAKSIASVLKLIENMMGWDTTGFQTTFGYRENYVYTTLIIDDTFSDFKQQILPIQDKFISSAVTSKKNFRITTKEPIAEEAKRLGLIIGNKGVYQKKYHPQQKQRG